MTETGGTPRRRPLTRERVVAAALDIIDREGLAALNVRRLADDADVRPMTLYHHFPNKGAILDAVGETIAAGALSRGSVASASARGADVAPGTDASFGDVAREGSGASQQDVVAPRADTSPASDGWRDEVRTLFGGLHALVQAHPRALPLISTAVLRTPSGRRWMEELMRVLLEAGFSVDEASRAYHLLGGFTLGLGYARMLGMEVSPEAIAGELVGHWADYPSLLRVGMRLAIWDRPGEYEDG
ncbi:MAG TPA: TetR/AcrR family transcriptional regulator, partial [Thermoleophilia bacterium]|nr:TetR/AcrR family transcriptional regulator [Thermoleophilia bacterium]